MPENAWTHTLVLSPELLFSPQGQNAIDLLRKILPTGVVVVAVDSSLLPGAYAVAVVKNVVRSHDR